MEVEGRGVPPLGEGAFTLRNGIRGSIESVIGRAGWRWKDGGGRTGGPPLGEGHLL